MTIEQLNLPKAEVNEKGHFVIPISQKKVIEIFNGFGICDHCGGIEEDFGYLIPVLGSKWYCEKCYEDFVKTAVNYEEDRGYEQLVLASMERRIQAFGKAVIDEFNSFGI